MNGQDQTQTQQQPQQQNPKQPERVDELDVAGGLVVKAVKYFFAFYRKLFKSQQYS